MKRTQIIKTKIIYIQLFKRLSEGCRYLIKVTDKDGNNIELTRNKLFLVDKKQYKKKSFY